MNNNFLVKQYRYFKNNSIESNLELKLNGDFYSLIAKKNNKELNLILSNAYICEFTISSNLDIKYRLNEKEIILKRPPENFSYNFLNNNTIMDLEKNQLIQNIYLDQLHYDENWKNIYELEILLDRSKIDLISDFWITIDLIYSYDSEIQNYNLDEMANEKNKIYQYIKNYNYEHNSPYKQSTFVLFGDSNGHGAGWQKELKLLEGYKNKSIEDILVRNKSKQEGGNDGVTAFLRDEYPNAKFYNYAGGGCGFASAGAYSNYLTVFQQIKHYQRDIKKKAKDPQGDYIKKPDVIFIWMGHNDYRYTISARRQETWQRIIPSSSYDKEKDKRPLAVYLSKRKATPSFTTAFSTQQKIIDQFNKNNTDELTSKPTWEDIKGKIFIEAGSIFYGVFSDRPNEGVYFTEDIRLASGSNYDDIHKSTTTDRYYFNLKDNDDNVLQDTDSLTKVLDMLTKSQKKWMSTNGPRNDFPYCRIPLIMGENSSYPDGPNYKEGELAWDFRSKQLYKYSSRDEKFKEVTYNNESIEFNFKLKDAVYGKNNNYAGMIKALYSDNNIISISQNEPNIFIGDTWERKRKENHLGNYYKGWYGDSGFGNIEYWCPDEGEVELYHLGDLVYYKGNIYKLLTPSALNDKGKPIPPLDSNGNLNGNYWEKQDCASELDEDKYYYKGNWFIYNGKVYEAKQNHYGTTFLNHLPNKNETENEYVRKSPITYFEQQTEGYKSGDHVLYGSKLYKASKNGLGKNGVFYRQFWIPCGDCIKRKSYEVPYFTEKEMKLYTIYYDARNGVENNYTDQPDDKRLSKIYLNKTNGSYRAVFSETEKDGTFTPKEVSAFYLLDSYGFNLNTVYGQMEMTLKYLKLNFPDAKIVAIVRPTTQKRLISAIKLMHEMQINIYKKWQCDILNLEDYCGLVPDYTTFQDYNIDVEELEDDDSNVDEDETSVKVVSNSEIDEESEEDKDLEYDEEEYVSEVSIDTSHYTKKAFQEFVFPIFRDLINTGLQTSTSNLDSGMKMVQINTDEPKQIFDAIFPYDKQPQMMEQRKINGIISTQKGTHYSGQGFSRQTSSYVSQFLEHAVPSKKRIDYYMHYNNYGKYDSAGRRATDTDKSKEIDEYCVRHPFLWGGTAKTNGREFSQNNKLDLLDKELPIGQYTFEAGSIYTNCLPHQLESDAGSLNGQVMVMKMDPVSSRRLFFLTTDGVGTNSRRAFIGWKYATKESTQWKEIEFK